MTLDTVDEIYSSIDRTRDKLIKAVSALNDERSNFRLSEEKWSVANIIEHLAKTEENLAKLIAKLLARAETEGKTSEGKIPVPVSFAEMSQKVRDMKLEAPEFMRPTGTATITEALGSLEKTRSALHALRDRIAAVDLSNANYPHPFFGTMNAYYWLAFVGLHELHHLKQVSEILSIYEQKQSS